MADKSLRISSAVVLTYILRDQTELIDQAISIKYDGLGFRILTLTFRHR
jgi:hypothetical protein